MAEKLKREFIELLERDREFRYTTKLWENQNRLWEEIRELRLEQGKMRRYMVSGFRSLSRALGLTLSPLKWGDSRF